MTDQKEITPKNSQITDQSYSDSTFSKNARKLAAVACSDYKSASFDMDEAVTDVRLGLKALNATEGLQEMVANQMLSIHHLQQISAALANASDHNSNRQYYTNSAVKLANCFIQQATLLAKLQGVGGQKIVVEHVEVHQGGQAVVGNINGINPTSKVKK